ncbi:cupredoxin domain-containing protein [Parvibium lacunae]|uniref:Cupredoxin domain-containing protein n=2 Tax=Parvibium lacunae TaxID=1888893 RepID=A0A368L4G5_9BURK|nr:cupredoxin domain-containing protein [Parvibium lacunae]
MATVVITVGATLCHAQEAISIVIKNHRFEPNVVRVPAGQRVQLLIDNQDDSAEEFESYSLRVEKIIPAKSKTKLSIGPLKPGKYVFFGEFNPSTATGQLIAE